MRLYVPTPGKDGVRRYGKWAGRPEGEPEDLKYCIAEVGGDRMSCHQCARRRGHGRDGLYCRQHAKMDPVP